ncbi:MAG: ABC transporter permease [Gammaproteobacteria bacterium]|nr:MAG: ABC transporter permease [Gammaproteobacteria bacterium]
MNLARLGGLFTTLLGVVTLVFFLIHWIPGDPVDVMLGESATPSDRAALRHRLGLDLPLYRQYLRYLHSLAHLHLGTSLHDRRPVGDLIAERLPATVELAGVALLITLAIAFPLGTFAAARHHTPWDRAAMTFSLLGVSIPNFWLGPLLILVFSLWLGWFPVSGREGAGSVVLPALTLGTSLAAILSRMIRSSLLDVLGEDYVRTARAKGLDDRRVLWRHALPNALLPVVTVIGLQLGSLLAGAVITETIFSWPGIGLLTIEAIQRRDYPVVQGCILFISLAYVGVNLLTDLLYRRIDPRIRTGTDR